MAPKSIQISHWPGLTPYQTGLARQAEAVESVLNGGPEHAFFLEHSPVFTTGTSASPSELLKTGDIPVVATGRGGKTTYHGPGQRVVYLTLDLAQRDRDLRAYVKSLQDWLIASLADLGVQAHTTDDVGVWVNTLAGEAKIAAIGVRVRKWVTFHGIALNVNPSLSAYDRIVPCGLHKPVTSLHALGKPLSMAEVDAALAATLPRFLGI